MYMVSSFDVVFDTPDSPPKSDTKNRNEIDTFSPLDSNVPASIFPVKGLLELPSHLIILFIDETFVTVHGIPREVLNETITIDGHELVHRLIELPLPSRNLTYRT